MKKIILLFSTIAIIILQNQAQTVPPIVFNSNLTYGQVNDVDGNTYKTIVIGTQTWMAENLRTTKCNDGKAPIDSVGTGIDSVGTGTTPAYCNYNNTTNSDTIKTYGRLYNLLAVNTDKLCPVGWHVPSDSEWTILTTYLGGDNNDVGGHLKEAGTTHWLSPNAGADNSSGFTALPGGFRDYAVAFIGLGIQGNWWSSTYSTLNDWSWCLRYNQGSVGGYTGHSWFSVRCLNDSSVSNVNGINEINYFRNFKIYPNPASDKITIAFNNSKEDYTLEILNTVGQVILSKKINATGNSAEQVDLTGQAAGVYFVKLQSANSSIVKKIIKN